MAGTDQPPVVTDAAPLIHLDELTSLDLLRGFPTILVPREVWTEIVCHRPRLTPGDVPGACIVSVSDPPGPRLLALARSLALDVGETAALGLMEARRARLLLCDDAAARLAAESLGFVVHGTIGVLVRGIRTGMRTREEVLTLLRSLPQRSTLHISAKLLTTIIAKVEQAPDR